MFKILMRVALVVLLVAATYYVEDIKEWNNSTAVHVRTGSISK